MNQRLEDYKQPAAPEGLETDAEIRRVEKEVKNTKKDLNDIDPEVVVASGDEEAPVSSGGHDDALKSLYAKGRKNRKLTTRADAEGTPDVARLEQLYAWAGQEMPEGEAPAELDTNTPDRFAEDRGEETREAYLARLAAEYDAENEGENTDTGEKVPVSAPDALQQAEPDATVEVTILGRTMTVPQQDIDDAGGLSAYQKNRAATIRLQKAATLERKAQATLEQVEQQQHGVQQEDLSEDGSSNADVDVDSLHEEMMSVVVNGTEDELKAWLDKKVKAPAPKPKPKPTTDTRSPEPRNKSEIQAELDEQLEADRVEANTMMQTDYKDIMADPELLGLAQQRFSVIKTNPLNEGRSQKEMAREAANFVRGIGKRVGGYKPNPIEQERQTRIERKRSLPSQTRADQSAPAAASKEQGVPTRREHFLRLRRMAGHQD